MIKVDIKKHIKTYNGLDELSIKTSFETGSITQIYGPSGAGKTTFLKIIAGLTQPEHGMISIDNEIWLDTKLKICLPPRTRKVGFVFQDYALFPNMTVEQHLKYGTKDAQYIERLLSIGKMEAFLKQRPKQLSGGQQQRLAILRALSTKPGILLMDEPFSALDNVLRMNIIVDLKQLLTELGTTCLIVTHHPFEADEFAEYSFKL